MASGTPDSFRRIKANDQSITEIGLTSYDSQDATSWGEAIGDNIYLKKLELSFPRCQTTDRMVAFWEGLTNNRSIEKNEFVFFPLIREREFGLFMDFFKNNCNLKELIFCIDESVDRSFNFICSSLSNCKTLKYLEINGNKLPANRFLELSSFLAKLPWLERILLWRNEKKSDLSLVSTAVKGWIEQSKLRELEYLISDCGIIVKNDLLVSIANLLKFNTHLEKLNLGGGRFANHELEDGDGLDDGWDAMEESLCLHNDTFHEFSFVVQRDYISKGYVPPKIQSLFLLNQNKNKKFVRFRKGLDYDFLLPEREFNAEPFGEDFDIRLLPHVLSSIGSTRNFNDHRSEQYRKSALFYFVRSMPLFVVNWGKNVVETDTFSKRRKSARIAAARKKKCLGK